VTRFDVHVVPRSPQTRPDGWHGGLPRLRLKAPPSEGRANAAATKALTDLLGAQVTLVSGQRSRHKIFSVDLDEARLAEVLSRVFGQRGKLDP
jgi:uncharacterized protein